MSAPFVLYICAESVGMSLYIWDTMTVRMLSDSAALSIATLIEVAPRHSTEDANA